MKKADICIVGAGPAGMLLGLLLAKKGISVIVLESHKDFEREYRGEVLMPRFTRAFQKIGLFDRIMKEPHLKLRSIELFFKNWRVAFVKFSRISPQIPFALWMPQPVLLNALYQEAKDYPHFQMMFSASVRDLIQSEGKITGVVAESHGEKFEIRADITVGADGRYSAVRKSGDFKLRYEKYNFDIIWFTVSSPKDYDNTVRGFFSPRHNYLILPKQPDSLQCGLVVSPGGFTEFREKGIEAMRKELLSAHSVIHPFARELKDFHPFSVLQARIEFVDDWAKNGCLLIGDAAHTCSPAGAIGVAVAVETAITASRVLSEAVQQKDYSAGFLKQVQTEREDEVLEIHRIQSRLTNIVFTQRPGLQYVAMFVLFILAKIGFMARLQKRLAVGKE